MISLLIKVFCLTVGLVIFLLFLGSWWYFFLNTGYFEFTSWGKYNDTAFQLGIYVINKFSLVLCTLSDTLFLVYKQMILFSKYI
jgi:hypothetical protein